MVEPNHLKNMGQNGESSLNRGEHKKYLSCHHPNDLWPKTITRKKNIINNGVVRSSTRTHIDQYQ